MKHIKFLFSGAFMGLLLLAFAAAIAYATFVENDYDATTAKMVVYNAWWFEGIMLLMVINFAGMIFTKKLYTKRKLNILVIHLALIVIIIGAAITRYVGFEGQMRIRNGQTIHQFLSSDEYIQVSVEKDGKTYSFEDKIMLSSPKENLYQADLRVEGNPIAISLTNYYPNAVQELVSVSDGEPHVKLIVGNMGGRHESYLKLGDQQDFNGTIISFGDTAHPEHISIIYRDSQLWVRAPDTLITTPMDGGLGRAYVARDYTPMELMIVHTMGNLPFILTEFEENGYLHYVPAENENQRGLPIIRLEIEKQVVQLRAGTSRRVKVQGAEISVFVGNKLLELPFGLKLREFELERYPGSNSPSSYASYVEVIDEEKNHRFDYKIYMNHILDYRGYRFFQSSYDQDEKGTILSVNHDFWGTLLTYIGYALLFGSLILSFFTRKTRFAVLTRQLKNTHDHRKQIIASVIALIFLLGGTGNLFGQARVVTKDHADAFGNLLVQDREGRIEPANTAAIKILMKIHKKTHYKDLSANQVFLEFASDPEKWRSEPIIKVNDPGLRGILGMLGDHARLNDFLGENQNYKLQQYVDLAYRKKPAQRTTFDKEVVNVDERANVFYMALNGTYLNIFPVEDDPNNKWITPGEFHRLAGHGTAKGDMFENYVRALNDARVTGDYSKADAYLETIYHYQREAGAAVIPSDRKIERELFYNKAKIFQRLFPLYLTIGLVLVALFFLETFNPRLQFRIARNVMLVVIFCAFVFHTYGLGLRWYISGHAPWSNGYESMIYISWATMLAGFLFMKRSQVTLAVTTVLAGITLLTAHMSWMNPEITNLVPVLKSYWLTIHVATITASYGFLGLACLMGFLNLLLMIFRNQENEQRINLMLKELSLIVELAMIVGLVLLIIGNFLGGVWANESWGRYWGWDPKESWTLVSVIVYSFVLHLRLIPSLRSSFTFNLFSVISFGSILMTYFGVNFYLSGLHSYANGDPVPIPSFIYYTLAVLVGVAILAGLNENKHSSRKQAHIKVQQQAVE